MLAHAGEKRVYDALIKSELTEYLRANLAAFDLIVSADALVYFGELESVLAAAAGALRSNGLFVFTLEHDVRAEVVDYRLELHGRYGHARTYVERLLAESGLEPTIGHADLRMEAGVPVAGLVVRATTRRARGLGHLGTSRTKPGETGRPYAGRTRPSRTQTWPHSDEPAHPTREGDDLDTVSVGFEVALLG